MKRIFVIIIPIFIFISNIYSQTGVSCIGKPIKEVEAALKNDTASKLIKYGGDNLGVSIYVFYEYHQGFSEVLGFGKSDTCFAYMQTIGYPYYSKYVEDLNRNHIKTSTGWINKEGTLYIDVVRNENDFSVSFIDPRYSD